jgi:hypothetical protein
VVCTDPEEQYYRDCEAGLYDEPEADAEAEARRAYKEKLAGIGFGTRWKRGE